MTSPLNTRHQVTRWPARGPARVLVILERPMLAELIKLTLNHGVYSTRAVATTDEVEAIVADWQPHLVVLDMDLDGTRIIGLLNGKTSSSGRLPIIGLTRRGDLRNKLAAFEAGVDDILTVPFAPEELLARVIALLRRSYSDAVTFTPVIKIGELEIDILKRTVRAGTSELHLTSLEQSLLYLLAANAGRVVTREEILDTLWGVDYVAESNVVDRQIRNLRARLQNDWRKPRFIATVPGRGYRFLPTFTDSGEAKRASERFPRRWCSRAVPQAHTNRALLPPGSSGMAQPRSPPPRLGRKRKAEGPDARTEARKNPSLSAPGCAGSPSVSAHNPPTTPPHVHQTWPRRAGGQSRGRLCVRGAAVRCDCTTAAVFNRGAAWRTKHTPSQH